MPKLPRASPKRPYRGLSGEYPGGPDADALRLACVTGTLETCPASAHDLRDQFPVDVGQAEIPPLEAVGQPLVVEAEQVQQRGM